MKTNFWVIKSEPSTYSLTDLKNQKETVWDGIRNYQARNFIRQMNEGDIAVFYHSGDEKSIVGTVQIISKAFQDPGTKEDWSSVKIKYVSNLKKPISLAEIKSDEILKNLIIVKQGRLSVGPVTPEQFQRINTLASE